MGLLGAGYTNVITVIIPSQGARHSQLVHISVCLSHFSCFKTDKKK